MSDKKRIDALIHKVSPAGTHLRADPYKEFNNLLARGKGVGRKFGADDLKGYSIDWNSIDASEPDEQHHSLLDESDLQPELDYDRRNHGD